MITIKLVGFGNKIAKTVKTAAANYREALEALKLQEGFNPLTAKVRYVCEVDGVNSTLDLDEPVQDGVMVLRRKQTLQTLKGFQGSGGSNGWVKVVVGIVLITVAVFLPPVAVGFTALASAGMVSINLVLAQIGFALIVGGLAQELMPTPENDSSEESSNSATSYPNTVRSGTPVAMIFGRHRFGGHLFQFNIESVGRSSADIRNFTNVVWDEVSDNKRDSWSTLFFNSESQEVGSNTWSPWGREIDGIRQTQIN
ncbi:hypothetical protein KUL118_01780 [Tenacibaculum sp. KUL118]|nr:hypothetical protein KUL118_01780 [Tenacibaculum sp. KUL118]